MLIEFDGYQVDAPRSRPDDLLLNFSLYPAGLDVRTVGQSSRYLQICWDDALYAQLAPDLPSRPGLSPVLGEDAMLVGLVRALGEELGAGTLDRLLAESLVSAVALRTAQRHGRLPAAIERAPDMARNRLRRVMDHIEAHLGEELSLVELAEVARINPCHLSKSFKAGVGIGLQRYVMQRRIERAKALLAQTRIPLVAIAQDLGFSDQSHFTNVFRREIGTTPARFRTQAAG
jgi:AraC-like DNA-binding protein